MGGFNDDDGMAHVAIWIVAGISLVIIVGFVAGVVFGYLPIPFPV